MSTVDYYGQTVANRSDPARLVHNAQHIAAVTHRLSCSNCLAEISDGATDQDRINDAVDAQLDLLVGAYGSERMALYAALRSLGEAGDQIVKLIGRLMGGGR